jgi:hypothetical protein
VRLMWRERGRNTATTRSENIEARSTLRINSRRSTEKVKDKEFNTAKKSNNSEIMRISTNP